MHHAIIFPFFSFLQNVENRVDTYEGVGSIRLALRRSVGFFGTVEVAWQASPREADTADFSPAGGTVVFEDGQTEAFIEIEITDDDVPEDLQVNSVNKWIKKTGNMRDGKKAMDRLLP